MKNIKNKPVENARARAANPIGNVTMIAATVGGAAMANMIVPGVGSAMIGGLVGAWLGRNAVKEEANAT